MSYPNEDTEVKVSSDGAQLFVDWYYRDLNEARPLSSYYINSNTKYTNAGVTADITINGANLTTPSQYEALLEEQRGTNATTTANGAAATDTHRQPRTGKQRVRYEVDSFDAQVINDDYLVAAPEHVRSKGPDKSGGRISMVVSVMGTLHLDTEPEPTRKTFSDVFVLVPNWDSRGRNAPRNAKRFLIASQNYRTL
ncbi:hypothetical protein M406DRAFT_96976 [Cryphonectria parasitica EP155]|uniref:NTF2 domain-containing protein n=1 Tax=Cryphonectria parasitica (strain ATCC 38755 / EP155) TaxID=660469 RepID=A0A9P4YCE1_CRYP1|nr:uncharacterized protein M406DRAFT_96976 [Cryphonectria parasitica EP155]KAF3770902.1 hypothetical protein M406DRAFT_96976 [Cryphonectria parasitica EP155]